MSDLTHISVIEDSEEVLKLLSDGLTDAGYSVQTYTCATDFEKAAQTPVPELYIVDLGLPDKDGLNLVSQLSSSSDAAILVISGRASLQDRIVGLELGADDYLSKPFEMAEVVARVRALIRRKTSVSLSVKSDLHRFAGWTLDLSKFVLIDADGTEQRLSAGEVNLLQFFLERPNRLVTRDQLRDCLLYTSPSPRDATLSRMPSSA